MKSANAGSVIPVSWASAGVGYQHSTQGVSCRWRRDLAPRYACPTALVRSAGMSAPSAGVLGSRDSKERIAMLPRVHLDRRRLGNHLKRCVPHPGAVVGAAATEGEAQERVGAALAQLLHDLFQQRTSPRRAPHDHLPAGLHA